MEPELAVTDHSAADDDRSKTPAAASKSFVLADLNVDLTESDGNDYAPVSTAPDFTSYLTLLLLSCNPSLTIPVKFSFDS